MVAHTRVIRITNPRLCWPKTRVIQFANGERLSRLIVAASALTIFFSRQGPHADWVTGLVKAVNLERQQPLRKQTVVLAGNILEGDTYSIQ